MTFRVGEVRVAEDKDFDSFKALCMNDEGWKPMYDKKGMQVFSKQTPGVAIQMMKIKTTFEGLAPSVLYDVLHDEEYRREWDKNMIEASQVCLINPNNDICYYSLRVAPLKARDFVMQRSWLATPNDEYVIFNHSVSHRQYPLRKTTVRAISILTGYFLRPAPPPPNAKPGVQSTTFAYLTQCDPRGRLPTWIVNKAYQYLAPRIAQRLYKIALKYPAWKSKHQPDNKPWLHPELSSIPRINWSDILQDIDAELGDVEDETQVNDLSANGNEHDEDDD